MRTSQEAIADGFRFFYGDGSGYGRTLQECQQYIEGFRQNNRTDRGVPVFSGEFEIVTNKDGYDFMFKEIPPEGIEEIHRAFYAPIQEPLVLAFAKIFATEVEKKEWGYVYSSGYPVEDSKIFHCQAFKSLKFKGVSRWSDCPYREVYISEAYKLIFTYCEGDLSLDVCTPEGYLDQIQKCEEFYKQYA